VATIGAEPDRQRSDAGAAEYPDEAAARITDDLSAGDGRGTPGELDTSPQASDAEAEGRRRFTIAVITGIVIMAVPYIWILWGPWESPNPIRKTVFEDNFYDLQARAIFHGHLWLANGAIGIEAFVHGGHQYTYFGLFPSIIRMPILAVTSSLDGKLTAPFMLLAWLVTALFVTLLTWRVRVLIRGSAVVSRFEATAYGILVATVMGGTVFMLLAATPFVFNEDIAWSICLTVGSLFALLGVVERPSRGRVIASFVLVLAANLDRATTGWACVVAAILIAAWFGLGRLGRENRRWCLPIAAVGLVPLIVSCAINYSKFGVLFGVSNYEQVWTHVNAYRRKFLAANHNAEEGVIFVPTNIVAYLRPNGLRLTSIFPFITLPGAPPRALGGVLFDRRYRTASITASSPLLFLLSCWGLVAAFRPHGVGKVAHTRILLLASGAAGAAILLWGYIAPRYLGDFVPFLALAAIVGLVDICRRLDGKSRSVRIGGLAVIGVVALFAIVANIGMAITPNEEWNTTQVLHYVEAQHAVADLTGQSLSSRVERGSTLPPWGPADQLFVVGACDGLYISNGEDYSTVPSEQLDRTTWMVVEYGHSFEHTFRIGVGVTNSRTPTSRRLVTFGPDAVVVNSTPTTKGGAKVDVALVGPGAGERGISEVLAAGASRQVVVITDPPKHLVEVSIGATSVLAAEMTVAQPIASAVPGPPSAGGTSTALSVADETGSSQPTLCWSLVRR
jgi:hypothetical protein